MDHEFIGQMIVFTFVSLVIGGLGFVQYKSDIPFNVGFNKEGYDQMIVSKIMGRHVMLFSVFLFICPIIFEQLKDFKHYRVIGPVFFVAIVVTWVISMNRSITRCAKIKPKITKTND